jgi:hypothetical protein
MVALALGIASLAGVVWPLLRLPLGLLGAVVGIIALALSKSSPTQFGGRGKALAGMIISIVTLALAALPPLWARSDLLRKRSIEAANLHDISLALTKYAQDHGAGAPDLQALVKSGLVTPKMLVSDFSGHAEPACDYSYVEYAGADAAQVKGDWFALYSDPQLYRGEGGFVLFLDSHVEFVKEPEFSRRLAQFQLDYRQALGKPPTIIPASPPAP